jgi:D-3-phosphoglycerate dehydrogenase
VLNQAGGNKEAVAEHALAMMLSLTKRIVEATARCGAKGSSTAISSSATTCATKPSASSASAMSASARGTVPRAVLDARARLRPYVSAEVMKANGVEKVELDELMRQADFRLDQLPADRRDARHGRREAVCA